MEGNPEWQLPFEAKFSPNLARHLVVSLTFVTLAASLDVWLVSSSP